MKPHPSIKVNVAFVVKSPKRFRGAVRRFYMGQERMIKANLKATDDQWGWKHVAAPMTADVNQQWNYDFDTEQFVPKEAMEITLPNPLVIGKKGYIEGLPKGARVMAGLGLVEDYTGAGRLEISTDVLESLGVIIMHPKFLTFTGEINVAAD